MSHVSIWWVVPHMPTYNNNIGEYIVDVWIEAPAWVASLTVEGQLIFDGALVQPKMFELNNKLNC